MSNQKAKENKIILHREAESLKELVEHSSSVIQVCCDSIRLNAIPEMQGVADVLETLIDPLYASSKDAKRLEQVLYQAFLDNDGKCVIDTSSLDMGELS